MSKSTELSTIMQAEAKIALPEIVSIFVAKHETALYERKAALQATIAANNKDLEILHTVALKSANFDKYDDVAIPKLDLVSYLKNGPTLNWDNKSISQIVGLNCTDKTSTGFSRTYSIAILKVHLESYKDINKMIADDSNELKNIALQISDMSRKERQIKARISEVRLEEQGLTDFLNDKAILQLIKID